jgi:hypothetical protein
MLPGADAVALTRKKAGAAYLAKLRRAYTDVPDPASLPGG